MADPVRRVEKTESTGPGKVKKVIDHDQGVGRQVQAKRAHGVGREDSSHAEFRQGHDIGAIIDLVRGQRVVGAVARQEQYLPVGGRDDLQDGGAEPVLDRAFCDGILRRERFESRAPDYGDFVQVPRQNLYPRIMHSVKPAFIRLSPFLCLTAFVSAVLYPFVFLQKALYWGDLYLYFYPMQDFVRESLLRGRVPLWNPYVLCGQPLFGNPQSWVFYPATFLLAAAPVWLFFTLSAVLHLVVAALGAYLYLRRICHDRLGALLGASVYAGSGYLVARLQFPNMAQSTAYLPFLLLLVDRLIAKPEIGYAGLTAVVVALCTLAAHAQIAYLTLLCAAAYAAARLYQSRRHGERVLRAFAWLAASITVGLAAASVQLLPSLQLIRNSTREELRWFEATRFTLNPEELVNFAAPHFYGHPARGDYWGSGNLWESCVYVGIIPLLLAALVIKVKSRRPAVAFYSFIGLVSLLLAMGAWGGLFWIAFYAVPGVSSFHDPARFAFLTTFAFAALSAIGMKLLRERGLSPAARSGIAGIALIDLCWFSSGLNPAVDPSALQIVSRPPVGQARVYSYAQRDLWRHFINYADYGPAAAGYLALLSTSMAPNAMARLGVAEASGYEPVPIRAMTQMDRAIRQAYWQRNDRARGLLSGLGVGIVSQPSGLRMAGEKPIPAPGWRTWSALRPGPSMWLTGGFIEVRDAPESLGTLSSPAFHHRDNVTLQGSGPAVTAFSSDGSVEVSADGLRGRVFAGAGGAILVRSAAYYPGWEPAVDGIPRPLLRVNHALQGVFVPEGRHQVEFQFRPQVFRVGLYITLGSMTLVSFALCLGWLARRTNRNGRRGKEDLRHNV